MKKECNLITDIFDEEENKILTQSVQNEFNRTVIDNDQGSDSSSNDGDVYMREVYTEPVSKVLPKPTGTSTKSVVEILPNPTRTAEEEELKNFRIYLFFIMASVLILMIGIQFILPSIESNNEPKRLNLSEDIGTNKELKMFQTKLSRKEHSLLLKDINIPILLDFPKVNSVNYTTVLSNCLGLKSVPVAVYLNELKLNKASTYDFLTLNSLCGWHQHYYRRLKFFFLVENPFLRLLQDYEDNKDLTDPKLESFDEYLNWISTAAENNNVLTRSILCKKDDDLSTKDMNDALSFLDERVSVGDIKNYTKTTNMLQQKVKWRVKNSSSSISSSAQSCFDSYFRASSNKQARLLDGGQYSETEQLHKIYKSHSYDMDIYLKYAENASL